MRVSPNLLSQPCTIVCDPGEPRGVRKGDRVRLTNIRSRPELENTYGRILGTDPTYDEDAESKSATTSYIVELDAAAGKMRIPENKIVVISDESGKVPPMAAKSGTGRGKPLRSVRVCPEKESSRTPRTRPSAPHRAAHSTTVALSATANTLHPVHVCRTTPPRWLRSWRC